MVRLVVAAVLLLATWRLVGLGRIDRPKRSITRAVAMSAIDEPSAERFEFSADAMVILGVGHDGQPGRAGVDDNGNGMLDDPSELGAVGSDDECLAPSDEGYDVTFNQPHSIVISRGAFIQATSTTPLTETRSRTVDLGWLIH